jgi:glycosyltransferase involved in cell wall biosynthesis
LSVKEKVASKKKAGNNLIKSKKILLIAYYFPPQGTVGTLRALKLTKYLPSLGWQPFVLTIKENREHKIDESLLSEIPREAKVFRTSTLRLDQLYAFGRRIFRKRRSQRIQTATLSEKRYTGIQTIISAWIFNLDEIFNWLPFAVRTGLSIIKHNEIDIIYSTSPPKTCHLVGYLIHRFSGKPWVADFRDPWRDNPSSIVPSRFHKRMIEGQERLVIKKACKIVSASPTVTADFKQTYPDYRGKFLTITNGFDPDDFDCTPEYSEGGKLNITYAGSLYSYSKDNQITPVYFFEAVKELLEDNPRLEKEIEVNFVGSGDFANVITGLGLEKIVNYLGYMSHNECLRQVLKADVVLLIVGQDYAVNIPAKVFEYLAARKPILALATPGAATQLLKSHGTGIIVPPNDISLIKNALSNLHIQHTQGGLKISKMYQYTGGGWQIEESTKDSCLIDIQRFAWPNLAKDFSNVFENCIPAKDKGNS